MEDLVKAFEAKSVPYSEINSIKTLFENHDLPGVVGKHQSKNYGQELSFVNLPVHFGKMAKVEPGESPTLGQHNQEVLGSMYDPDYIECRVHSQTDQTY